MKLPPPLKLERQLTGGKWESGEEHLVQHPEQTEALVAESGPHVYKVLRRDDKFLRVHGDELCTVCGRNDIRYPEHAYTNGFRCGKCISSS